jgi:6-phosphofructokinase 1
VKRVAVLTSGGDAPGMNAAIRAVVRTGTAQGMQVLGVRHGFTGLISGDLIPLGPREVGGIIERGGTILGSTRCAQLRFTAGQEAAVRQVRLHDLDALVVIGGNGSQQGSRALAVRGLPVVGITSTIDNDLPGFDITIGATTALSTALEAIDRLRVTGSSHERAFLVEVMGRECGYLALMAGIAGGAECIVVPEAETSPSAVAEELRDAYQRGKSHGIVVVAEGSRNNADALARYFQEHQERLGFELRVTRLGHVQRGGSPCAFDRLLATQLGAAAISYVAEGRFGMLLGMRAGAVAGALLDTLPEGPKPLDRSLFELAQILAR